MSLDSRCGLCHVEGRVLCEVGYEGREAGVYQKSLMCVRNKS